MHDTANHIRNFQIQRPTHSDRIQANLGLQRTSSTDTRDSNQSRKCSSVTFDDSTQFQNKK